MVHVISLALDPGIEQQRQEAIHRHELEARDRDKRARVLRSELQAKNSALCKAIDEQRRQKYTEFQHQKELAEAVIEEKKRRLQTVVDERKALLIRQAREIADKEAQIAQAADEEREQILEFNAWLDMAILRLNAILTKPRLVPVDRFADIVGDCLGS
jgi:predicted transport protein